MNDTYGRTSLTPLAYYDPESCSWKMCQDTFPWEDPELLATLPAWGMTRNGVLSALPTPGRLTAARESSSLLLPTLSTENNENRQSPGYGPNLGTILLPTPTRRDHKGHNQRRDATCLPGALLPTPRASHGPKGGPNQRGSKGDLTLPSAVMLLPTPAVNDMGAGKTVEAWDTWTATMQAKHGNGNGHGKSLSIEVLRLVSTGPPSDGGKPS